MLLKFTPATASSWPIYIESTHIRTLEQESRTGEPVVRIDLGGLARYVVGKVEDVAAFIGAAHGQVEVLRYGAGAMGDIPTFNHDAKVES